MAQKIEGVPEGVTLSPVNQVQGVPPGVTLTPINKGSDTMGAAPPAGIARPELKPLGLWDSLRERVMGDTEPTPFNTDTTPKDTSLGENLRTMGNAASNAFVKEPLNIAKRAGRTAFSMADAPVQGAAHVVKGLLGNEQEADKALGGGPGHLRDYLSPLDYLPTTQVINRGIEFGKEALNHPFGDDGSGNSGLGTAFTNAGGDLLGMDLGGKAIETAAPPLLKATGEASKWAGGKLQQGAKGLITDVLRPLDMDVKHGADPAQGYLQARVGPQWSMGGIARKSAQRLNEVGNDVGDTITGLMVRDPATGGLQMNPQMKPLFDRLTPDQQAAMMPVLRKVFRTSRDNMQPEPYGMIPLGDAVEAVRNPYMDAQTNTLGGPFGKGMGALNARMNRFPAELNPQNPFTGVRYDPLGIYNPYNPDLPVDTRFQPQGVEGPMNDPTLGYNPVDIWNLKKQVQGNVNYRDPANAPLNDVGQQISGGLSGLIRKNNPDTVPSLDLYHDLAPVAGRSAARASTGRVGLGNIIRHAGIDPLVGGVAGTLLGHGSWEGGVGGALLANILDTLPVKTTAATGLWNAGSLLGKGGGALSDFAGDMSKGGFLKRLFNQDKGEFTFGTGAEPPSAENFKKAPEPENLNRIVKPGYTVSRGGDFVPPPIDVQGKPMPDTTKPFSAEKYHATGEGNEPHELTPLLDSASKSTGTSIAPVETPKLGGDEWQRALQEFRAKEAPKPAAKSSFLKRLLGEDRGEFGIGGDEPPTFGAKDKLEPHELTPLDTHFFDKNTGFGQEGQPFNIKGDVIPFKKGGDVSDRGADLIRNLTQHPEDEPEKGNLIPLNSFKGNFNALGDPDKAFKLHDPNNLPEPLMMPKRLADASKPDLSGLRGMANSPEVQERLSKMKPKDEPEPPTPPKGVKAKILNFIRDESGNLKIPDYIQESLRLKDTKSLRVAQEDLSAAANQVDNEIQQAFEAGDKEKLDHLNTLREWLEYVHSKVTGAIGTPPPPKPSNRLIEPAKSQQRSETMQKSWNSRKGIK